MRSNATTNRNSGFSNLEETIEMVVYARQVDGKIFITQEDNNPLRSSTLFDPKPVEIYLALIAQAKLFVGEKKYAFAIDLLDKTIKEYLEYPDAYIELAEIYLTLKKDPTLDNATKFKHIVSAINSYAAALKILPWYSNVIVQQSLLKQEANRIFLQIHPHSDGSEPYMPSYFKNEIAHAKRIDAIEKNFRAEHHGILRKFILRLPDKPFTMQCILTPNNPDKQTYDDCDVGITNGGVKDAFLGYCAQQENSLKLAAFFYEKAILKFNHDFISITNRAYLYAPTDLNKAIEELNICIADYDFSRTHIILGNLYLKLGNVVKAKEHYILGITRGNKLDLDMSAHQTYTVIMLLNDALNGATFTIGTDRAVNLARFSSIPELLRQDKYQGIPAEDIQTLTAEIRVNPHSSFLYLARGMLHFHLKNYESSKLNFSLAALVANDEEMINIAWLRCLNNIILGESIYAEEDYRTCILVIATMSEKNSLDQIAVRSKLLTDYLRECTNHGKLFFAKKEFYIAEKLFYSAYLKNRTANLAFLIAKAQLEQNKFESSLNSLTAASNLFAHTSTTSQSANILSELNNLRTMINKKMRSHEDAKLKAEGKSKNLAENARLQAEKVDTPVSSSRTYEKSIKIPKKPKAAPQNAASFTVVSSSSSSTSNTTQQIQTTLAKAKAKTQLDPVAEAKKRALKEEQEKHKAEVEAFIKEQELQEKILAEETQSKLDELVRELDAEDKRIKEENEAQRRKNKNLRAKARRLRLRADRVQDSPKSSVKDVPDSTFEIDTTSIATATAASSATSAKNFDDIRLELVALEKTIFDRIAKFNQEKGTQYLTYIVGGSVYDRVRTKLFDYPAADINDLDIITELPGNHIYDLFNDDKLFPDFRPIPEIPGLFCFQEKKIKVDLYHKPNLLNLNTDAQTRDFIALYMDSAGKVFDPTRFSFHAMQTNKLRCVTIPSTLFKTDPIRILRAIYTSTKRKLRITTTLKEQIKKDKTLLIPSPDEITLATKPYDAIENYSTTPFRFNSWLLKLFSQGYASTNYGLLAELEILDVLFSPIAKEMKEDEKWLIDQMVLTSKRAKPSLEIIFTTFIVAAIMLRTQKLLPDIMQSKLAAFRMSSNIWESEPSLKMEGAFIAHETSSFILSECEKIITESLLFQDKLMQSPNLKKNLAIAISHWKHDHQLILAQTPDIFTKINHTTKANPVASFEPTTLKMR
jgi:tRNA nucleotidyltransferase/poly(A) polymerase